MVMLLSDFIKLAFKHILLLVSVGVVGDYCLDEDLFEVDRLRIEKCC